MEYCARRSQRNPWMAKYGRKSRRYRRRTRKMPYRGGTVNVGVREEVESYIDLIHREPGEIAHFTHRRGGSSVRQSEYSDSLSELHTDHRRR
ncbi:hypothetical protein Acr_24g0003580 [Actinidia rufa]|uniref:Uncharacterized protein n=1 Tax=Actinidia rufa TaxID=165716 RepID=A0A7J0GTQ8_9ERIC|nr:hypothetical protein Acr_24g0003580 [Actinidia rufa]